MFIVAWLILTLFPPYVTYRWAVGAFPWFARRRKKFVIGFVVYAVGQTPLYWIVVHTHSRVIAGVHLATVIAGVGIILSVIMLIAFAVFGKQLTAYGRCLSLASTSADRQACQTQFIHAVNRELTTLQTPGSR